MAVAREPYGQAEDVLPAGEIRFGDVELRARGLLLAADSVLLGLQEFERDRVRVESPEELLPVVGKRGKLPRQHDSALGRLGLAIDDLGFEFLGELLHP